MLVFLFVIWAIFWGWLMVKLARWTKKEDIWCLKPPDRMYQPINASIWCLLIYVGIWLLGKIEIVLRIR